MECLILCNNSTNLFEVPSLHNKPLAFLLRFEFETIAIWFKASITPFFIFPESADFKSSLLGSNSHQLSNCFFFQRLKVECLHFSNTDSHFHLCPLWMVKEKQLRHFQFIKAFNHFNMSSE